MEQVMLIVGFITTSRTVHPSLCLQATH